MATIPEVVRITLPNATYRDFPTDTSFEPYRREAFRHRSQQTQREGIAVDNIVGEGMLNPDGLWRRGQIEWTMGAGSQYLDSKRQAQEDRFLKSKGVDVFTFPMQATLLPDTHQVIANTGTKLLMTRCGDFVVVAAGGSVSYYTSAWSGTSCTFDTSTYGGSSPTVINSICANDTYTFLATDTGVWFCNVGVSGGLYVTPSSAFQLYAAPDTSTGYTGGYDLVRWANDQLLGSKGPRLYAFQPRSASSAPYFGDVPFSSAVVSTATIAGLTTFGASTSQALIATTAPHGFQKHQKITIANSKSWATVTAATQSGSTVTATTSYTGGTWGSGIQGSGLVVGETIEVSLMFGSMVREKVVVQTIVYTTGNPTGFTYTTKKNLPGSGFQWGNAIGAGSTPYGYNGDLIIQSIVDTTHFAIPAPTNPAYTATGGTATSSASQSNDILWTHPNPGWVWSDIAGGETQVYLAGYVKSSTASRSGCIYRSGLVGASTTTATNVATTSNTSVFQSFYLNTPVQALPMSPDEYPVCIESYLNFIFIGTNRGIRMAQTLSVYDPTATQTGDLKSGPLSPNILQPVVNPVTAIVGDGRYVWFAWNNYDGSSTGLGKLDLSTYIDGDPLAPAYASDIMVTGQGTINSLEWDPVNNIPVMAVQGLGIYAPYATNSGGNMTVTKYVASGTITSGLFDYGLVEAKIPVFFDFGAVATGGSSVSASLINDPTDPTLTTSQSVGPFTSGSATKFALTNTPALQFQVTLTLSAGTSQTISPILHRWSLRSWPTAVAPTDIMLVIRNFGINQMDGVDQQVDPYDNFIWLWNLRNAQTVVTYSEGPLSATCVVRILDWLPHEADGTYKGGFRGDLVATLTTIGDYVYTATPTA